MDKLLATAVQVAPIFALLAAGYCFKKWRLIPPEAVGVIKSLLAKLCLPAVIFGAFSSATLDRSAAVTFVLVFLSCSIALGAGLGLDALLGRRSLRPFLMTAFEAGMLGLPLFGILYGPQNISRIAMADLGEIVFTFLVLLPLMSLRGGGPRGLGSSLRRLYTNPIIWAVVLGLIAAATGLSRAISATLGGQALFSTLSFAAAPTGTLILFIIGYDLDFGRKSLGAALPTIVLRYLVMLPLLFASRAFVMGFGGPGADRILYLALTVLFLMPPSFAITVFGGGDSGSEESRYLSTTLSLNTLVALSLIALFVVPMGL